MLERHPPRRDPRVFLLDLTAPQRTYACVDAFEVRGLGALPRRGITLALQRLTLELRPSHVILVRSVHTSVPRSIRIGLAPAALRGLPVVTLTLGDLPVLPAACQGLQALTRAYPELRHLLPPSRHRLHLRTLRRALAVLFHHPLLPRHYAPRLPACPTTAVDRPRT